MGAFSKYSEMLLFSLTERVYKVGKNSQITYRTSSVNTEATSIGGLVSKIPVPQWKLRPARYLFS